MDLLCVLVGAINWMYMFIMGVVILVASLSRCVLVDANYRYNNIVISCLYFQLLVKWVCPCRRL